VAREGDSTFSWGRHGSVAQEVRWFKSHGISLVVPMMDASDRLAGALLLGEKKSEEPYSDGDRYLLDTVARQVRMFTRF
jgi:hypothetical protein